MTNQLNFWFISNLKFFHALLLFVDDPIDCNLIDCTEDLGQTVCPKTCSQKNKVTGESEICKYAICFFKYASSIIFCQ